MGIRFILMVNKQGQTRLAQYYEWLTLEERRALEGEIVRKCLARNEQQCSFVEHRNYKIVYRRYASLFFLVGVDNDEVDALMVEILWRRERVRGHRRMSLQYWNLYISWLKPWTAILAMCVS
ncbi:hypothetical protein ERO13_D13G200300v2 [Gossypium hirsutum]|uniref:AP-4 complex subunit sigma isoform X2 n=2 Tax=Gossypium TaxID=3633 RepID=A0A1U8LXV5_GOSHI|nr:AP-4 complex subunit sigma isoform X2 [Gossypium hirsutum]KAG4113077.1 hypothetical protein ERO13_D13G200300v2 [Gossypium hirsutum]KJB83092.1 hypothetical protein B456_013G229100 [Gossypium raimondii]